MVPVAQGLVYGDEKVRSRLPNWPTLYHGRLIRRGAITDQNMMGRSLALSSRYSHASTRRQSDVGLPLRKL